MGSARPHARAKPSRVRRRETTRADDERASRRTRRWSEPSTALARAATTRSRRPAGFPGELNVNWLAKGIATFDCEYGFSCMGYEIAGAWGARMARRDGEVIAFVGDGSYLMLNSELYSSVVAGHKLVVVLCDNGGYAVIDRLQVGSGRRARSTTCSATSARTACRSTGSRTPARSAARPRRSTDVGGLEEAFVRARAADRTYVIASRDAPDLWTEGGAFWEVGVPEVSDRTRSAPPAASARGQAPSAHRLVNDPDPLRSECSGPAGSAACTPSSSRAACRVPCWRPCTIPTRLGPRDGAQARRPGGVESRSCSARRRRGRDLHEHRHARRADRCCGVGGQGDLLREAARAHLEQVDRALAAVERRRAVPGRVQPSLRPRSPRGARCGRSRDDRRSARPADHEPEIFATLSMSEKGPGSLSVTVNDESVLIPSPTTTDRTALVGPMRIELEPVDAAPTAETLAITAPQGLLYDVYFDIRLFRARQDSECRR